MDIKDAISKLDENMELKQKITGKYLCSALSFLDGWSVDSWELNYYDEKDNKIIQITVTDSESKIKSEGEPFKEKGIEKIEMETITITASKALEIAKAHYDDKYQPYQVQRIFLALHGGKNQRWAVSVITKHLVIVMISIDTKTGEITESKAHTLFDKNRTAY